MSEERMDFEPPVNLPRPQTGAEHGLPGLDSQPVTEETASRALENTPATSGTQQSAAYDQANFAASAAPVPATGQANTVSPPLTGTPPIADDVDLIEKEWVDKAKEIVERTKRDPYNQNKQMNEVKADYLKKRYNKDVKLPED